MNNSVLCYSVGALLYCPANNRSIADSIVQQKFGDRFSLAMCLEDTINDNCVAEAEEILIDSLQSIFHARDAQSFFLPKIFIRIRNPQQMLNLWERFGEANELITGFILPKFSLENADAYIETILTLNRQSKQTIYLMPILESPSMISLQHRYSILYKLKEKLDSISELVLNIRVGGNDLCHIFGFRRHSNESIHSIKPVSHIFSDIITVFGIDYVVSGPVWEYYNGDFWESGLKQELRDDKLCGFIGKTVIHPKQIPIVNAAYRIPQKDWKDAKAILNWDTTSASFVSGNVEKERMNEYKTHSNWALRTLLLAEAFGIE